MWLNGLAFLLQSSDAWPVGPCIPNVTEDDHEVKKNTASTLTIQVPHVFEELIARYSTWTKLQRAFAWLLRF